ncbi:MAG TPA: Mpo1-like protein [Gammaproteobacteria bacterium]|nr:Mpo1-like protein [Gammaproteobacteria bacterium]
MAKAYKSFREFYPLYLGEHRYPVCRRLHCFGSCLVLLTLIFVLVSHWWWGFILMLIFGYGFAWVGHFFFEHNRPATFTHPFYSFMGDWAMFRDILLGRIPF